MDLNANSISIIEKTKADFEEGMKARMVNDTFRNFVEKAIPLKDGEYDKINNPDFKSKLTSVLSDVSGEMVNQFENVSQFDTGNLFTSMVTSISDSVSLEADYRVNKLYQRIRLGKINQNDAVEFNTAVFKAFENNKAFESEEIKNRFSKEFSHLLSTEEANDIVERIKDDVKTAIDETEAKNDLVEGTTKEIIDYKNEVAPPDDQYQDPENPDTNAEDPTADPTAETDPTIPDENGDDPFGDTTDTSDDGMSGDGTDDPEGSDDQLYEGDNPDSTDDGTGTDSTSTGDDTPEDPTSNEGTGDDPTAEGDTGADPTAGGDDTGTDDLGTDDTSDMGDETDGLDTGDAGMDTGDTGSGDTSMDTPVDDPSMDAAPDAGAPAEPAVSDGNSNQNSGGITININGADLKKAKESLNLFSARSLAEKRIPVHPREFNNAKLPSIESLSAECVNAGLNVDKEMKIRLDYLKYATKEYGLSKESVDTINAKIDRYGKIIGESINNANTYTKTLENMGITAQGLIYSNENTLCIARNIINRFLTKTQFVSPTVRPYTSKENVFANAFDIVQLRKYVNSHESVSDVIVNDLFSRENLFYHNMVNYNDPEVKKQAHSIIDLSQMNFKKAMSPNFITDYRIKAWELNVGDKANKDVNEEVVKRVKDKFEKLWLRELNADEMKIIRGAANQEDVTELTPTPYEKFMITMSKEAIMAHGCEDPSVGAKLSKEEKKDIEWKSRLMTTVYKTAEAFGVFNKNDSSSFDKFTNMVGM